MIANNCPLCSCQSITAYYQDKKRDYLQCENCDLVFVPRAFHLSSEQELAEYNKHQNDPRDKGYRQFLSRVTKPLFARIALSDKGLDFGCGPGPAISAMAKEQGIKVNNYDLYYFNQPSLLEKQYQFITLTEVIEHLASPMQELSKLNQMLVDGGILAVMTKRVANLQAFKTWHYKNDPTHISFYSEQTFEWIAQKLNWQLEVIDKDVVFFTKIAK